MSIPPMRTAERMAVACIKLILQIYAKFGLLLAKVVPVKRAVKPAGQRERSGLHWE